MGNAFSENTSEQLTDSETKILTDILNVSRTKMQNNTDINFSINQIVDINVPGGIYNCNVKVTQTADVDVVLMANFQNRFTQEVVTNGKDQIAEIIKQKATQKMEAGLPTSAGFFNKNKTVIETLTKTYVDKNIQNIVQKSLKNTFTERFNSNQKIRFSVGRYECSDGQSLEFTNEFFMKNIVNTMVENTIKDLLSTSVGTEIEKDISQISEQSQSSGFSFNLGAGSLGTTVSLFIILLIVWRLGDAFKTFATFLTVIIIVSGVLGVAAFVAYLYFENEKAKIEASIDYNDKEEEFMKRLENNGHLNDEDPNCFRENCPSNKCYTDAEVDNTNSPCVSTLSGNDNEEETE